MQPSCRFTLGRIHSNAPATHAEGDFVRHFQHPDPLPIAWNHLREPLFVNQCNRDTVLPRKTVHPAGFFPVECDAGLLGCEPIQIKDEVPVAV
jgi:hypothetical protein